jgi:hypothetical protein
MNEQISSLCTVDNFLNVQARLRASSDPAGDFMKATKGQFKRDQAETLVASIMKANAADFTTSTQALETRVAKTSSRLVIGDEADQLRAGGFWNAVAGVAAGIGAGVLGAAAAPAIAVGVVAWMVYEAADVVIPRVS